MALSHELTQLLRSRIFEAVFKFAREFDLDPRKLEVDIAFLLAHLTGHIGILSDGYQEWLNDRFAKDDAPTPKGEGEDEGRTRGSGGIL